MWNDLVALDPEIRTPCYVYDLGRIRANARGFVEVAAGQSRLLFATMANPRREVVAAVHACGFGVFANSLAHLELALSCGIEPANVVFAGSGHSLAVLERIAATGASYCADSVGQLASYLAVGSRGDVGVRVNLGTLLGLEPSRDPAPRLGITRDELAECLPRNPRVTILHVYLGTNLTEAPVYEAALAALVRLAVEAPEIRDIDLGGGFAASPREGAGGDVWRRVLAKWVELRCQVGRPLRLTIEPGRAVVRTGGALYTSVTDVKERGGGRFVLVDSSATWYPRAFVHGATDHVVGLSSRSTPGEATSPAFICGSSTFSRDVLAVAPLPEVRVGDVLEFAAAGAYCEAMHMDFLGMAAPDFYCFDGGCLSRLSR